MMEILTLFSGSFILALSGALMPGPLLTLTVAESARRGFRAGPLLMTGHGLLELILIIAVIAGLGPLLESRPVMGWVALVGGLMLAWLGIDMVRTAPRRTLVQTIDPGGGGGAHPIVMGALVSLSNPYWTLWWATIGLGYLLTSMQFGVNGVAAFFSGHISADFAWYCLISLGVSRGRNLLGDAGYRTVIRCCGVFLVGFGGWFLYAARGYFSS